MIPAPPRTARGFTLVELMIVISIIAILSAMSVGVVNFAQRRNRIAAAEATIQKLDIALRSYQGHCGVFPPTSETPKDNRVMYGSLTGDMNHDGVYTPGENGDISKTHRIWRGPYIPVDPRNTGRDGMLKDPWGTPYGYFENQREEPMCDVNPNSFLLYSCGPDLQATDASREDIIDYTQPHNKDTIKNWED